MDDPYKFFPKFKPKLRRSSSPSLPSRFWLVVGKGESDVSSLNAFDAALLDAGIGHLNLIQYSSILPENASISPPPVDVASGSRTGAILAIANGSKGENISAGIAFGKVSFPSPHYVVFEAHGREDRASIDRRLRLMVQEAVSLRHSTEKSFLTISNGFKVNRTFGCILVAVVFDPTVYS